MRRIESFEMFRRPLERQLETMLSAGFHKELGIPEAKYIQDIQSQFHFINVRSDTLGGIRETEPGVSGVIPARPVIVEPRIEYRRQAELLGIKVDPNVIEDVPLPPAPNDDPHVQFTVRDTNGHTPRNMMDWAPIGFEPAHPIAGLVDHLQILKEDGFTLYPGPEKTKIMFPFNYEVDISYSPCLDTFLGKPRLTSVSLDVHDPLWGMAFRYRYPRYDHKNLIRNYIQVDPSYFRPK